MFRKRPKDEPGVPARRDAAEAPAPSTARLEASLQIIGGPGKGETIRLSRIVTLLGRQDTCDIVLGDQTVSREHGQIEQSLGQWVYTNFSENGTWVNRKKAERVVLNDGDTIEMGAETRMKFLLREPQAAQVVGMARPRPRRSSQELETIEAEVVEPKVTIGESLRKRRKLIVGLAVYLVLLIGLIIVVKSHIGGKAPPPRNLWNQWTEDQVNDCLELKFDLPPDPTMANKKREEAYIWYQQRATGDPMSLYNAIRAFRESMEYSGRPLLGNFSDQRTYEDAKKTLATELWNLYRDAGLAESQGETQKAREFYNKIMRRIASDNPFYKHVLWRQSRL